MKLLTVLAVSVCLLGTQAASAAPTTYKFEGILTSQYQFAPIAEWQFAAGQSFHGELVYDPEAVTTSWNYISDPNWNLTFHYSPLVSLSFTIDLPGGAYSYDVPTQGLMNDAWQYVAVGDGSAGWNGVDIRTHNYPTDWSGPSPSVPVPASAYVGAYNPHMVSISLFNSPWYNADFASLVSGNSADVDLAALHASLIGPETNSQFNVRFSDSSSWNGEGENLQAVVSGRIDRLWAASSVPEPASWALMIIGLGAVGAGLRHSAKRSPVQRPEAVVLSA
ncbi:MAG TPA: PEPxxWA-CTERM sorting domain-containing protein [Sphingobium sp.]